MILIIIYVQNHTILIITNAQNHMILIITYVQDHMILIITYVQNHLTLIIIYVQNHMFLIIIHVHNHMGLSWPWSYGSWIYNYLCNHCLSLLLLWVRLPPSARCTTLGDKVCQWLVADRWLSPGPPVSSTNKTDRHDITEILLKVALYTIKPEKRHNQNHMILIITYVQNHMIL
jgi:hypothetical protein